MRWSTGGNDLFPSNTHINDIKPKLLESGVTTSDNFFRLSDGFQKIFANDKKD